MDNKDYICSLQFEQDWKRAKREVERAVKPLFGELSVITQFRATVYKSSQIAWIDIREPHPSVRLIAVSLPRDVEPLTLRVTCWFYQNAISDYQQWCNGAMVQWCNGAMVQPFYSMIRL